MGQHTCYAACKTWFIYLFQPFYPLNWMSFRLCPHKLSAHLKKCFHNFSLKQLPWKPVYSIVTECFKAITRFGPVIDSNLNFNTHIENIPMKIKCDSKCPSKNMISISIYNFVFQWCGSVTVSSQLPLNSNQTAYLDYLLRFGKKRKTDQCLLYTLLIFLCKILSISGW